MSATGIWVIGAIPDEAARRLASQAADATDAETDAIEDLQDAAADLMADQGSPFVAVARKANPVEALCNALGTDAMRALPGVRGNFILTADEVAAALPEVEAVLDVPPTRRAELLTRITTWMTETGDDPGFDAAELLDAPLRILREAASSFSGAAAFTRWY
ncbi:hypothetical protein [Actinomadura gamaensis]|uniref:Uncharacterized protein n=1 Tax=Actinomadura gamaensis TaxID=1763541 RepID=A0ABV9U8Z0_9ACTN